MLHFNSFKLYFLKIMVYRNVKTIVQIFLNRNHKSLYVCMKLGVVRAMTTVLTLLGFDVMHVLLTLTSYNPSKVVALISRINGTVDRRSLVAYSLIGQVATSTGIEISRYEIDVKQYDKAVVEIKELIKELITKPPLIIDLSGGMRLLVVETLLAYISLPDEDKKNIRLVIFMEGTNQNIELHYDAVREILLGKKSIVLTDIKRKILDSMEYAREYSLSEVHRIVKEQGFNVTKQYVHKVLKDLVSEGLIIRTDRGRYVKGLINIE